jgi:type I restriction enzyme M protein
MKSYSKTKPIKKEEFNKLREWWNNRKENENAWKVPMNKIKENGFNLDFKNPYIAEQEKIYSSTEILQKLEDSIQISYSILEIMKKEINNGFEED